MRQKVAALNTGTSLLYFLLKIFVSFFIRKWLIICFGVEILGVQSVVVDTIAVLALCEMGIQSSIIYRLYVAIGEGDTDQEAQIYSIFCRLYKYVGISIGIFGIILLPFIGIVINTDIHINTVRIIYVLQLGSVVLNYFLSCPRLLYIAHQKQYKCTKYDIFFQILAYLGQTFSIFVLNSYFIFLLCNYITIVFSNFLLRINLTKEFDWLKSSAVFSSKLYSRIKEDLKDIISGNLATFIYSSTDNIILSVFFGAMRVGYIANYKLVTGALKSLIDTINNALAPIWGNYLNEDHSVKQIVEVIRLYNFIIFIICYSIFVPATCLVNDFVSIWLGNEYLINSLILYLIIGDVILNSFHQSYCMVLRSYGLFSEDKYINIVAASINIISSIILSIMIGESGVFIGTIVALIWYFVSRFYVSIKKIKASLDNVKIILKEQAIYILFFVCSVVICDVLVSLYDINTSPKLIGAVIAVEAFCIVLFLLCFFRHEMFKKLLEKIVKPLINKKRRT